MAEAVTAPTTTVTSFTWTVSLVEELSPRFRYEIIEGVLYMSPTPLWPHSYIVKMLLRQLDGWAMASGTGEVLAPQTGIYLDETRYLDPDLVYLRPDQVPRVGERCTAATLAVEVLSPSNLKAPRHKREALLRQAGVEEIWYVDYEARSLEVRRLEGETYATTAVFREGDAVESVVLPGLSFPLSSLWEGVKERE